MTPSGCLLAYHLPYIGACTTEKDSGKLTVHKYFKVLFRIHNLKVLLTNYMKKVTIKYINTFVCTNLFNLQSSYSKTQ